MIKVKISEDGNLSLNRAGKLKQQYCPRHEGTCGDHCPLFEEPFEDSHTTGVITVCLCDTTITCEKDEIQDDRKGDEL